MTFYAGYGPSWSGFAGPYVPLGMTNQQTVWVLSTAGTATYWTAFCMLGSGCDGIRCSWCHAYSSRPLQMRAIMSNPWAGQLEMIVEQVTG